MGDRFGQFIEIGYMVDSAKLKACLYQTKAAYREMVGIIVNHQYFRADHLEESFKG